MWSEETTLLDALSLAVVGNVKLPRAGEYFVAFKQDMSSFFLYGKYLNQSSHWQLASVHQFEYPSLTKIKEFKIDQNWSNKYRRSHQVFWDAENAVVMVQHQDGSASRALPYVRTFDVETGMQKDSISFYNQMTEDDNAVASGEAETRSRIGNNALSALFDLKESPIHHDFLSSNSYIDAFTEDGYVLTRYPVGSGEVILWKFPEGVAHRLYYNSRDEKQTGLGTSPVKVDRVIYRSFISPDAKWVGLNTIDGAYFFLGNDQKLHLPDKVIIKIANDKALVCTMKDSEFEKMFFIDLNTGNMIADVKLNGVKNCSGCTDIYYAPDKVYFTYDKKPDVSMFDFNNPREIITWEKLKIDPNSYVSYYFENEREPYLTNRFTGVKQLIAECIECRKNVKFSQGT
jgi:hypothetical protein